MSRQYKETWLRQIDTWEGGGDTAMAMYVPQSRERRAVVTETDGDISVLRAPDTGLAHIVYGSVYPDKSMSETYYRISPTKYTTHVVINSNGKTIRVTDVCAKIGDLIARRQRFIL